MCVPVAVVFTVTVYGFSTPSRYFKFWTVKIPLVLIEAASPLALGDIEAVQVTASGAPVGENVDVNEWTYSSFSLTITEAGILVIVTLVGSGAVAVIVIVYSATIAVPPDGTESAVATNTTVWVPTSTCYIS